MKLRIINDIHLEFGHMDLRPGGDVLVLAGDVGVVKKPRYLDMVVEWSEMFDSVIYVAGNHEFYRGDIDVVLGKLADWSAKHPKIHFLENNYVYLNDILFIGATLWSDFTQHPMAAFHANQRMNDFRYIRQNNYAHHFRAEDAQKRHDESVAYIKSALGKLEARKKVVVTHYAPSHKSVHKMYAGDLLNYAFASNLEYIMNVYEPNLWIHGHTHNNSDYMVDRTRVICNPRGYMNYEMNNDFDKTMEIEI